MTVLEAVLEIATLIWAVSAAICWEAHGKALLADDGYWWSRTWRSLCPVFNTIAAYQYAVYMIRRK